MDTVESTSIGPGLVAFLIVVALIIATGVLWYSMVRHLRKVPPTFDTDLDPNPETETDPDTDMIVPPASPESSADVEPDRAGDESDQPPATAG